MASHNKVAVSHPVSGPELEMAELLESIRESEAQILEHQRRKRESEMALLKLCIATGQLDFVKLNLTSIRRFAYRNY